MKLTCPTLSGSKNRVHARKDGEMEQKGREGEKEKGESSHFVLRHGRHTARKINDLRVSDAISEIANKTDAASAYRLDVSPRACMYVCRRLVYRTNISEHVCS